MNGREYLTMEAAQNRIREPEAENEAQADVIKTAKEALKVAYMFVKGKDLRADIQAVVDIMDALK
jgi:hypothetical protein